MNVMARYGFPAAAAAVTAEENGQPPTIDVVDDEGAETEVAEPLQHEFEQRNAAEEEILQEIPLPGIPTSEADRRQRWLKIPRAARIAIRRLHQEFGHVSKTVLVQLLKATKAPTEYIDPAKKNRMR